MGKKHFVIFCILIMFFLISCSNYENRLKVYICPDGSEVTNKDLCKLVVVEEKQKFVQEIESLNTVFVNKSEAVKNLPEVIPEIKETSQIVTRVIDGDTFEINNKEKVRLICIDTPEKNQKYYAEAQQFLSDLLLNKEIKLEKDVSETDMYGRILRYAYTMDGEFINEKLIKEGYARVFRYGKDTKYCDLFEISEKQAQNQKLRMWSGYKETASASNSCVNLGCSSDTIAVGSKKSNIWHYCNCKWADDIKLENLLCFKTINEAERKGYRKTKVC